MVILQDNKKAIANYQIGNKDLKAFTERKIVESSRLLDLMVLER